MHVGLPIVVLSADAEIDSRCKICFRIAFLSVFLLAGTGNVRTLKRVEIWLIIQKPV